MYLCHWCIDRRCAIENLEFFIVPIIRNYPGIFSVYPVCYVPSVLLGDTLNLVCLPSVMEQYRKPHDVRYYDLPTENYESKLYYERTYLAKPEYRGLFRDKPHTVTSYHPSGIENQPRGFHGRLYYEQENPQFKYQGRPKNDLYWLENPPHRPVYPKENKNVSRNDEIRMPEISTSIIRREGNKTPSISKINGISMKDSPNMKRQSSYTHDYNATTEDLLNTYREAPSAGTSHYKSNRLTQDGPGYL